MKRASLRQFGREPVLRRVSQVLQPVLDRCVLISFDLAAIKVLRLMTGARIGWVLESYDADSLREATALAPEFLFCNLERVPIGTQQLWPGRWDWAIYEVRDLETARECHELGARYVETMAVRSLRTAYDEAAPGNMSFPREGAEDLAWLAGELSAIRRELTPPGESRALYLALDQGGTSSRAVLFDAVGREVATAHVPINTRRQGDDRVEHDATELLQSLRTADARRLRITASRRPPDRRRGSRHAALDHLSAGTAATGKPLSPALSWQDRRNAAWLQQHLGARSDWVRELTGLPLSPHYGASKLRWCLDELPEVRLALRDERLCAGPLASFLAAGPACSADEACADPANAARTLLFDPAVLDWSPPLLEAFGIPAAVLPRCVGTNHDYGTIPHRRREKCAVAARAAGISPPRSSPSGRPQRRRPTSTRGPVRSCNGWCVTAPVRHRVDC